MKELIKIFKALSDPIRLKIIKYLEKKKLCVCELREILEVSQPNVSHHLSILKEAGLVEDSKDGLWINYVVSKNKNDKYVNGILGLLSKFLNEDEEIISGLKKIKSVDRNKICSKRKSKR